MPSFKRHIWMLSVVWIINTIKNIIEGDRTHTAKGASAVAVCARVITQHSGERAEEVSTYVLGVRLRLESQVAHSCIHRCTTLVHFFDSLYSISH